MQTYQIPGRSAGPAARDLSVLGLGCSRVGSFSNTTAPAVVRRTLEAALAAGVTVFDTADIYGQGDSEREIGRLLKGRRDRGFVVTKAGKRFSAKMRALAPFKPVLRPLLAARGGSAGVAARRDDNMAEDFSPAHLVRAVDRSLARLRFERLDGLLLHSPPAAALADPAVGEALQGLVREGKVERFGVSCDDRAALDAALRLPGASLLQLPLDLLDEAAAAGLDLRGRGMTVFAREVIRLRPDLLPPQAVAAAVARPDVDVALAGASTPAHFLELAAACGRALASQGCDDKGFAIGRPHRT